MVLKSTLSYFNKLFICSIRNKDRQIEEEREKNNDELKFYKQKVKHLQYEHQNDLTECKAEAMVSLKKAQDDHTEQERELLRDKRNLKRQEREQEIIHQEQVKSASLVNLLSFRCYLTFIKNNVIAI